MDGGTRIGRIYFQAESSQPWRWSLSQQLAGEKRGRADSRALALQALIEAYASVQEYGEGSSTIPRRSVEARPQQRA